MQFAMSKELHTPACGQKIAGVRPFQNLDEAGKKRRTNYTVELAVFHAGAYGEPCVSVGGVQHPGYGCWHYFDRAAEQTC